MILKPAEIACLKQLAILFEKGETLWRSAPQWNTIGLDETNYLPVLTLLQSVGAIDEFSRSSAGVFARGFTIRPFAVELARQIEAQEAKEKEGKDVWENLKYTWSRHPVGGWFLAIVFLIGGVSFVGHNIMAFLKDLKILSP